MTSNSIWGLAQQTAAEVPFKQCAPSLGMREGWQSYLPFGMQICHKLGVIKGLTQQSTTAHWLLAHTYCLIGMKSIKLRLMRPDIKKGQVRNWRSWQGICRAKEWKRQRPFCMARFKSIYTLQCGARISPEMQNLLSSKQRELTVTGWYSKCSAPPRWWSTHRTCGAITYWGWYKAASVGKAGQHS